MFDIFRLKEVLVKYKENFVSNQWANEKYKWEAVKCFQDNWDVNASDFADMLTRSLSKTYNLLASMNDLIDTYFVGNMPNSVAAQSGMSVSWPFMNILMAFNMGIAVAGVAVISQFLGAGKKQEAKKYGAMLVTLGLILGVLINTFTFLLAPFVLRWMGAEGEVYTAGLTYVQVRSFEMVFTFFFAAFQSIRQSRGDTLTPVIYSTIGIFVRTFKIITNNI